MKFSLLPPWLPYAVAGVAIMGGVGMCARYKAQLVEKGRMEERAKVEHRRGDSLVVVLAAANARQPRVDTAWLQAKQTSSAARDSLRIARTAADSLARLLAIRDADTETIRACSVARLTCDERALAAEQLADARLRELKARMATPTVRRRWGVGGTVGFGTTYDLTTKRFGTGPSAAVGVTFSF